MPSYNHRLPPHSHIYRPQPATSCWRWPSWPCMCPAKLHRLSQNYSVLLVCVRHGKYHPQGMDPTIRRARQPNHSSRKRVCRTSLVASNLNCRWSSHELCWSSTLPCLSPHHHPCPCHCLPYNHHRGMLHSCSRWHKARCLGLARQP